MYTLMLPYARWVFTEIYLRFYLKYDCYSFDFREIKVCSLLFCKDILYKILWKFDKRLIRYTRLRLGVVSI
jgi:hypothetical protein